MDVSPYLRQQQAMLENIYQRRLQTIMRVEAEQSRAVERASEQQLLLVAQSQASQQFLAANGMNNIVDSVKAGWAQVHSATQAWLAFLAKGKKSE